MGTLSQHTVRLHFGGEQVVPVEGQGSRLSALLDSVIFVLATKDVSDLDL